MNPQEEWERATELMGDALELPAPERDAFLRKECAGNEALYQRAIDMLQKEALLGGFLQNTAPTLPLPPSAAAPAPAFEFPGTSRFELRSCLGSGGFGTVYEALDHHRGLTVALKTLTRHDPLDLLSFKREFRTLAAMSHPNLVQLYELHNEGRYWFFTMELIRGVDFITHVRRRPQDYDHLRAALAGLIDAVAFVHSQNKLHLDIKPSNIRVTPQGEVKLLDFGLVRDLSPEATYRTHAVGGTAAYMAPEQAESAAVTPAADWYAVGAVLFEALTGRVPFEGGFFEALWAKRQSAAPSPCEFDPNLPPDLNELCAGLLARDPAARPVPQPIAKPSRSSAPALIGRSRHLAELHAAFDQTRSGSAVCLHLTGESGMGKSALCREFLNAIRTIGDALILSGRCYESESVPFKAVDPIVDALGQHLERMPPAEAAAFLPRARPLAALARVFPTLLRVKPIADVQSEALHSASPRDVQRLAISALREILARLSESRPCIVSIDDLQWGDLDSAECLNSILAPPDPPRALFLFSYRTEDLHSTPHLTGLRTSAFTDLPVGPLSDDESAELYHALAGAHAPTIGRETDGMPFFIRELALHGQAEGRSLRQIIEHRIAALPAAPRRVIDLLAIAAQPLDTETIRDAAQLAGNDYPARNALLAANLIRLRRQHDREYLEPYHDKIRETAASLLDPARKRQEFEALAAALETREDADPELLHQYHLSAGNLERARSSLQAAATRAERTLAFNLAVRLRERLIDMCASDDPQRPALEEQLGDALSSAGHGLRAARVYQNAARSLDTGAHLNLIRKAGEQYVRSGHFEEGQALLHGLLQKTGFSIPRGRTHALASLAWHRAKLQLRGLDFQLRPPGQVDAQAAAQLDVCRVTALAMALQDPIRAAELQTRHLRLSLDLGEPYRIANSLAMEAGFLTARGGAKSYARACRLLEKVEQLAAQSNHPNGASIALSVRCKVAWFAGDWPESARCGEEANRLATEQLTRVAWEVYPFAVFWICALACMGRWREAVERLPGLLADSQARGDLLEVANLPVATFAYIRWLMSNEPDSARQELESARQRLEEPGFVPQRFGVWYGLTDLALYEGDSARAWQVSNQGWRQLESSLILRVQSIRILMLHTRARAALANAHLDEAARFARAIRKEQTRWGNAIADFTDAAVAHAQRHPSEATRLLYLAERGFVETGMQHYAAAVRYRLHKTWDPWFESQQFADRNRIVAMLSPGPW